MNTGIPLQHTDSQALRELRSTSIRLLRRSRNSDRMQACALKTTAVARA
jgi:hypothetical protein